jgi:2,4-dienoyl-CoA reductase-like NADH-dependent reductase (Old Yellow Enzyme family)
MKIFEPVNIAGIHLKNRIIRSATHEGLGDSDGFPDSRLKDIYLRLAKGGVGAVITGYAGVQRNAKTFINMRLLDKDDYIEAYQPILAAVKEYETPVILQLAHGGGMAYTQAGLKTKAPSKFKNMMHGGIAEELTTGEIEDIINSFVQAVERAKKAGFDGVQLHAAHGYLLSEFLSPHINRREDQWGGTTENRFRIIREIIGRSREKVGNYPIWAKMSAYDDQKNGVTVSEAVKIAKLFQEAGCDAIEVSCGNGNEDFFSTVRPSQMPITAMLAMMPRFKDASNLKKKIASMIIRRNFKVYDEIENYNVAAAAAIKASVSIPVIVVGGIRKLTTMEEIISSGKADCVSMCRPFILEPDLVKKMQSGKQEKSKCLNCNYCLVGVMSNPLKCYYGRLSNK